MKLKTITLLLAAAAVLPALAQPKFDKKHGLYEQESLVVTITPKDAAAEVRYTTDGSFPTAESTLYTAPLTLTKTTLLRAVEVKEGAVSAITTASYIFVNSVLSQPNDPEGYPATWGHYTEVSGDAIADYEMDPEMTGDATLRPKIIQGLKDLPILSIVTDKDNFFSHENDPDKGGIYIYTGPPVGDPTGNGWTRQCSAELFGGPQNHDLTVDCGIRLHGGHGRLAEKNPKHSMRLIFKKQYGQKTLSYNLYGKGEPKNFTQLVLRCHFGNSWQHWRENNREKAQYTRDVWARRMQRRMGHLSVNAIYSHVFINGMYWGIYNIAERLNDNYGVEHMGGTKKDYDIIKVEEEGGNHIEAAEGDLTAWKEMLSVVKQAEDPASYQRLDTLLDIPTFIDYMIINQYGGNNDWDHHNWYALRKRGTDSEGFKFLCWDSELILEDLNDNVLSKNNGDSVPTGIFHHLLKNQTFARQYVRRAKALLSDDGFLGQTSAVEVWDSLYNTIKNALYAEAARWGDFRRDVLPQPTVYGSSTGSSKVYTVDGAYMTERNRMLNSYFPYRTSRVLDQILSYVVVDDFELPEGWKVLTRDMFHTWNGVDENATVSDVSYTASWNVGSEVGGWGIIAGDPDVQDYHFADVSLYESIVFRGTGSGIRILANRATGKGPWKEVVIDVNSDSPYWDADQQLVILPTSVFKDGVPQRATEERIDNYVHINAIKVRDGGSATLRGIYLIPSAELTGVRTAKVKAAAALGTVYNLSGMRVKRPGKGIYVKNGKKIIIR